MIPGFSVPRLRAVGSWLVISFAIAIGAGFLFAWSGVYNIAATSGHLDITRAFLQFGMLNSVRTHSALIEAPPLDDEDRVRLGAGHFQSGCAPCHGAPGEPPNPIAEQMLPPPPNLVGHVPNWEDRHLFWIVKHGIKYAGMPAWATQDRDDEVWAVVAFLRRLSAMTAKEYQDLAHGNASADLGSPAQLLFLGNGQPNIATCAKCHGNESAEPTSNLIPRLAGQSEAYLTQALTDFAEDRRPSGIMGPIARELDEAQIDVFAAYYASLKRDQESRSQPASTPAQADAEAIVRDGVPEDSIPACISCHGGSASQHYPRLAGQPERYLSIQLSLFRSGVRANTEQARTMAAIAKRMSDSQIENASAYFARLPPFSSERKKQGASSSAGQRGTAQ